MGIFLSSRVRTAIENVNDTTDVNALSSVIGVFLLNYDVKMFTAALLSQPDGCSNVEATWMSNTTPAHASAYNSNNFVEQDYGVRKSVEDRSEIPFLIGHEFADTCVGIREEERRFYQSNYAFGLWSGLSIPIAIPGQNAMSGFSIWAEERSNAFGLMLRAHHAELFTFLYACRDKVLNPLAQQHFALDPLTVREKDCLALLSGGLRPDAIADRLCIATVTVNHHIQKARKKLKSRTNAEAVSKALSYRFID